MSAHDSISQVFSAFKRHEAIISDAYLNKRGFIPYTDDNEQVIKTLLKHRLVWHFDENDGVRLGSDVIRLLERVTRSERRIESGGQVGQLWDELSNHLSSYKVCKNNADAENIIAALQECSAILIQDIQDEVMRFSRFIERGYAMAHSLDLRIKQNEFALKHATALNDLIESCTFVEFQEATVNVPELKRIFWKHLPVAFQTASKELRRSLADLLVLVTKLRKEKELYTLVHSFRNHYDRNPGFIPSVPEMIGDVPKEFTVAKPILRKASPNIYSDDHIDELASIVDKLTTGATHTRSMIDRTPGKVTDARDQESIEIESDELFDAASEAIDWVVKNQQKISASTLYETFEIDAEYDIWLFSLLNTFYSQDESMHSLIKLDIASIPDKRFSGNQEIVDLHLEAVA